MLRNGNDDVHDIYDVDDDDEDDDDNVAAIGTRQYTKRRRRRSASVHETIVDEKLAPSGRDEERERQRSEIGRDTHVRARARTTGYTCMRAVVPRERERERTRKSERGRREIATLATTGRLSCTRSFAAKARALRAREKKYTHRSSVYEPPFPSYSSTPSPARRRHLLAPTILSLFFSFRFSLLLSDLCTRVYPRMCICAPVPVTCVKFLVCVCTRETERE